MSTAIADGKAAWARLQQGSPTWDDWIRIGHVLREGRAIAMRNAGTVNPTGSYYSRAFHAWLRAYGFQGISQTQRTNLMAVMTHLAEIEAWRSTLTSAQLARLNDPGRVMLHYREAIGAVRGRAKPSGRTRSLEPAS